MLVSKTSRGPAFVMALTIYIKPDRSLAINDDADDDYEDRKCKRKSTVI